MGANVFFMDRTSLRTSNASRLRASTYKITYVSHRVGPFSGLIDLGKIRGAGNTIKELEKFDTA